MELRHVWVAITDSFTNTNKFINLSLIFGARESNNLLPEPSLTCDDQWVHENLHYASHVKWDIQNLLTWTKLLLDRVCVCCMFNLFGLVCNTSRSTGAAVIWHFERLAAWFNFSSCFLSVYLPSIDWILSCLACCNNSIYSSLLDNNNNIRPFARLTEI